METPNRPQGQKKFCFQFAKTGKCNYGGKCKYPHLPNHEKDPRQQFINKPNATNGHPPPNGGPRAARMYDNSTPGSLMVWKRMVPFPDSAVVPLRNQMGMFFRLAKQLILGGEPDTMQEVFKLLSSQGGLYRVSELCNRDWTIMPPGERGKFFSDSVSPFLHAISHERVLASFVLEQAVIDMYNFLFGPSGRRGVRLFQLAATVLGHNAFGPEEDGMPPHIGATLTALERLISINGNAIVIPEFKPITEALSKCVDKMPHNQADAKGLVESLKRIKSQLKFGDEIPLQKKERLQRDVKPPPQLTQDLPGALSKRGRRHDNDHEDIADIKILPTSEEIRSERAEYLPTRDQSTWHVKGSKGLLDFLFRLLREDTVGQLRDAVSQEIEKLKTNGKQEPAYTGRLKSRARTVVYREVLLREAKFEKNAGFTIAAEFDQPEHLRKVSIEKRKDWWESSRRFQHESLLCFVSSLGETVFMTAQDWRLRHFVKEEPTKEGKVKNIYNDPRRAVVFLKLVEATQQDVLTVMEKVLSKKSHLQTLVEFPGVLLPTFRPTLQVLQKISKTDTLPFPELLAPNEELQGDATVILPAFARSERFTFHLRSILKNRNVQLNLPAQGAFNVDELVERSTLDKAQATALVAALRRRFALIQGPPGTGKSYTGVAMIKVLQECRTQTDLGPILCVCYTNHALDQLLEHLIKEGITNLIRIGSRSQSEILEKYNLANVSQHNDKTRFERKCEGEMLGRIGAIMPEIKSCLSKLQDGDSWRDLKAYLSEYHPVHHDSLFEADEEGFERVEHDKGNSIRFWLKEKVDPAETLPAAQFMTEEMLNELPTFSIAHEDRHRLHQFWIKDMQEKAIVAVRRLWEEYKDLKQQLDLYRQEKDLRHLQEAHIVGVTTTGLARKIDVLRKLKSKVLVCEEAGEILEAHTVSAMLPKVEQVILIGDHKQLRPQIQNHEFSYERARGERYALNLSLFERFADTRWDQGFHLPLETLGMQRRMHPSISTLIQDCLYPDLQDHPSVQEYPEVFGMAKRLFWLDHRQPEAKSDNSQINSTSKSNEFEAEMTVALVSHLVRQGVYSKNEIAVLTPYLGQLRNLRRRMARSYEVFVSDRDELDLDKEGLEEEPDQDLPPNITKKGALKDAIRIATVDNFQGEEAKVVVISLVRSNRNHDCGFLKTSNRINVLLSRAQHGMYIIGNSETSSHVPMWANVISILEEQGNIGKSLQLRCSRHLDTVIEVSQPNDFHQKAPEGGCRELCKLRLQCGHACPKRCHSKLLHNAVPCSKPCERVPSCGHACDRRCGEPCVGKCLFELPNIKLPCGHFSEKVQCHLMEDLSKVKCSEIVDRTVPGCQHRVVTSCSRDYKSNKFQCNAVCGKKLKCGHDCTKPCNSCNKRADGKITREAHGKCSKVCGRPYRSCSHSCPSLCHGQELCPPCEEPCEVQCAHSRCGKKCFEPCAPCTESCFWSCVHQGECRMPCAVPCDILPCSKRCGRNLSCGHQCPSLCGEACPSEKFCQLCCSESIGDQVADFIMQEKYREIDLNSDPVMIPRCGHIMTVSSMDGHMEMDAFYEMEDISARLAKPLSPQVTEGNIKTCPTCRGPLRELNRYNRIVRQRFLEENTRKFIKWANKELFPLGEALLDQEKRFQESFEMRSINLHVIYAPAQGAWFSKPVSSERLVDSIRRAKMNCPPMHNRFKDALKLRTRIVTFQNLVREKEQPFGRVYEMVRRMRQMNNATTSITIDRDVLNTRNRVMASLLLTRCDLLLAADYLSMCHKAQKLRPDQDPVAERFSADFLKNRECCLRLLAECITRQLPRQQVEARLYFARWAALERSYSSDASKAELLLKEAELQLDQAEITCKEFPSAGGMKSEVDNVRLALKGSFYSPVNDEEMRQVYEALRNEYRGDGHWYTCPNGHLFMIGECGGAVTLGRCQQCNAQIGGRDYQLAEGVNRANDIEQRFGRHRERD